MNLIASFNQFAGGLLPSWAWPALQILLGAGVMLGTCAQRNGSDRFKTSKITCTVDAITTRLGQFGLAVMGTVGFAIMIDGIIAPSVPPRATIIVVMGGYFMIQIRIIYQSIASVIYTS